uniref:CSON004598 protein n=1 Tax=Culicoides sonorensis TaxID=179676 RepID=A0A336LWP8_CULSO
MEKSFFPNQELVENIIYVEEESDLNNPPYTLVDFDGKLGIELIDSQPEIRTKDYICGSCDDSFENRTELDTHLKNNHPEIYDIVSSYRKQSETVQKVQNSNVQNTESCFTCKCGSEFQKFVELEVHVQIEHSDEFETVTENVEEEENAESENVQMTNPNDIEIVEEKNEDNVEFTSNLVEDSIENETKDDQEESQDNDDAPTSFVTIDELISKRIVGGKSNRPINRSYNCHYCTEIFTLKTNYIQHMKENHPDNPEYLCEICSKGFFDQLQLKKHKNTHNTKRFVCDICSKGFVTKSKLTVHLDVHFRKNTVDCEICGKTFAAKSGYRVHLKKHLGMWEKNIVCQVCNARFRYQYNLDVHMKSHSGQKDFHCDICNKSFGLQRQLQAHIDSHNGVRNFSCESCGQKFIRRQTWRRHILTHTGQKDYKCQICNAAYVDRRSLRKHLEKIHPNLNLEAYSKPLTQVPVIIEERISNEAILYSDELQI